MLHKHNSGFTLIELLVTVVVAAVLLAIAVPSFKDMIDRGRLKALSEALYEDIQFARSEALKGKQGVGKGITVSVDAANGCWGVVPGTASCDCTATSCSLKVTKVADNFPAVEIVPVGEVQDISIDSMRGTLTTGAKQITLRHKDDNAKMLQMQVSVLGHIRLCIPDGGEVILGYDSCGDGL